MKPKFKLSDFILLHEEPDTLQSLRKEISHLEWVVETLADRLRERDDKLEIIYKKLTKNNIDITLDH